MLCKVLVVHDVPINRSNALDIPSFPCVLFDLSYQGFSDLAE